MIERGMPIASGGFAVVYEASLDGQPCALKMLKSEFSSEEHRARFRREVRSLLHLQGGTPIKLSESLNFIQDRNVVPLIQRNVRDENESPWFAMPIAVESAATYLRSVYGYDAMWLFTQTCHGIRFAHSRGVLHRDIKPSNILLFEMKDNQCYAAVADFGIGRFVLRDTPTLTLPDAQLGTPTYWSPEQQLGEPNIDKRADIYALGKLLYEVLTGEPPASLALSNVPQGYDATIEKATRRNPEDRFQTVDELLESLP